MTPDELVREAREEYRLRRKDAGWWALEAIALADTLEETQAELERVKRNEPCPCTVFSLKVDEYCKRCKGSGKKYNAEKAKGE